MSDTKKKPPTSKERRQADRIRLTTERAAENAKLERLIAQRLASGQMVTSLDAQIAVLNAKDHVDETREIESELTIKAGEAYNQWAKGIC